MRDFKQLEEDIQNKIAKVINDQKVWDLLKHNEVDPIKPYDVITEMDYYAWPGGYPLYYITKDCEVLCPKCVNENLELLTDEDDPQWYVIGYEINYEDNSLSCDHCSERIERAYGDDDDI